jgi:hypothetical protein
MFSHDTRSKLEAIINGTYIDWQNDHCTAARNFLCNGFKPSTAVKKDFENQAAIKEKQAECLKSFITTNNLWIEPPSQEKRYLTKGGEAEIYFDHGKVIKVNDGIYYSTWLDFFTSILVHNLIFGATSYQLKGFIKTGDTLKAVLEQQFIIADSEVDLQVVKEFLSFNGFSQVRPLDYYNKELGLILEDIHDENVIINSGIIFFIDTVFYVSR